MKVVVKPYLFLRESLGVKEITIELPEGTSVRGLLQVLRRDHQMPEKLSINGRYLTLMNGEELTGMTVLINGYTIKQLQGIDTVLDEGSIISIFPPAAGG